MDYVPILQQSAWIGQCFPYLKGRWAATVPDKRRYRCDVNGLSQWNRTFRSLWFVIGRCTCQSLQRGGVRRPEAARHLWIRQKPIKKNLRLHFEDLIMSGPLTRCDVITTRLRGCRRWLLIGSTCWGPNENGTETCCCLCRCSFSRVHVPLERMKQQFQKNIKRTSTGTSTSEERVRDVCQITPDWNISAQIAELLLTLQQHDVRNLRLL